MKFRKFVKRLGFHWIWVDLVSLGIGTLFVWLHYRFATSSWGATLELFPNIATEIMGVWISVRIIDALIQRRDKFNAVRRRVVSECKEFVDIVQDVTSFDDRRCRVLRSDFERFVARLPTRSGFLLDDESELLNRIVTHQKIIVRDSERIIKVLQQVDDALLEVEHHIRLLRQGPQQGGAGMNLTGMWIDSQQRTLEPVQKLYDRFVNRADDNGQGLIAAMKEVEEAVATNANTLGDAVKGAVRPYHDAIRDLISIRGGFQEDVSQLDALVSELRDNIGEETELD